MSSFAQRIAQCTEEQLMHQRAADFCHMGKWMALGKGNYGNALALAQSGRANERVVEAIKAAMNAGTTTDGSFAGPLAFQELADGFLLSLRNNGIFDAALPFALNVPLNMLALVVTSGVSGASIGEGQSMVFSRLSLASSALNIRKCVALVAMSADLAKLGGARASRIFQRELQRGIIAQTDSAMLSVLTTGISVTPSNGTNSFGIAADFAALFSGLPPDANSKVFVAMNPSDVRHVAVQIDSTGQRAFPGINISGGGEHCGATIIPSDAVTNQMVAFDATQLALSSNGIELDGSEQALVQMDSVPDSPPSGTTNYVSLFQNNLVALRATRYFGCERLRSGAVSVVGALNYTAANSPA